MNFDPPDVVDPTLVGSYPAAARAGGGYVWDAVLEYRVWCHPHDGAPDVADGDDYYHAFASYAEAAAFAAATPGAEAPLALIRQDEFIDEPSPGNYVHVRSPRVTEWPVEFLRRPRRTARTIPDFLAPDAPPNRLDVLRGIATHRAADEPRDLRENARACPCCGHLTLTERGAFEMCPVCWWEDDGQDDADADVVRGGPNGDLSLSRARANYRTVGACDPRFVGSVRPPLPHERP